MTDWPQFLNERREEVGLGSAEARTADYLERLAERASPEEMLAVVAVMVGGALLGFDYSPLGAHKKLEEECMAQAKIRAAKRKHAYETRR